jgi:beta-galactosidase
VGYNNLSETLQGIHRAFYEHGIPLDFLHVSDLASERLSSYKLVISPYPVMMSQSHLQRLVEYVRGGGTLVAEARCGWIDERGFSSPVIPGGGLHEVFGCREAELLPIPKTGIMKIAKDHESLPLLKTGDKLDTLFFDESFELLNKNSLVLAEFENGKPAMVFSEHGKGRAILVGSFLGSAYHHFSNTNNGKFFAGLAEWLKIQKPVEANSSEAGVLLEARILEGEGYKLLFGFNRGEKATTARFRLQAKGGDFEVQELETGKKVDFSMEKDGLILEKSLEPREIWIVLIKAR